MTGDRDNVQVDETLLDIDFIPLSNEFIRLHNRFQQKRKLEYEEVKRKEREKAKRKKSYRQSLDLNTSIGDEADESKSKRSKSVGNNKRRTDHDTKGDNNNNSLTDSPANANDDKSTKNKQDNDKIQQMELPNLDKIHIPEAPNIDLEAGKIIPEYLCAEVPAELIGIPLVDPDPHYSDKGTYVVVDAQKTVYRFSMHFALYIFGPLNPIRRMTTEILTKSAFSRIIMTTIIINCLCMMKGKSKEDDYWGHILDTYVEQIFLAIYTVEMLIKVLSRGFVLSSFTYLRDGSNVLDIVVIATAYVEIAMTLTQSEAGEKATTIPGMNALRAFRVLRALKAISVVPGLKCIVSSLIESVKALRDVMILTLFTLLIFSLIGMQLLSGILSQKCIAIWPGFNQSVLDIENEQMMKFHRPLPYDLLNPPMPCGAKSYQHQIDPRQGWKEMKDPYTFQIRGEMAWFPNDFNNRDYTHTYNKTGYKISRLSTAEKLDKLDWVFVLCRINLKDANCDLQSNFMIIGLNEF